MDNNLMLTMKESQRHEVISRLTRREITEKEARKMIGLKSCRQVRRIKKRVQMEGIKGIIHKARGQPSNRKFPREFTEKIVRILKEKYPDFKPTLAWEKLEEHYQIKISLESLRGIMIKKGLWKAKNKRRTKQEHHWRERKSNYGEMQQFDGSYHKWFEDRGGETCLLASIDDATGRITKARFAKNEGVDEVFKFWKEYNLEHGIPTTIYLDKFSTYKVNHKAAEDNSGLITQFERACNQVGTKLISANSPEAKGRIERLFKTLQDRMIKEMRLEGVKNKEEGNRFLKKYLPKFNAKFGVIPKEKGNIHKKPCKKLKVEIDQIYSKQSLRIIQNDYTVLYKTRYFQLDQTQPTTVYKKDNVTIEEHLTGEIKIRKREIYLRWMELPERPKKQNIKLCALTPSKSTWKPPKNHPWRQQSLKINQKEKVAVN